jgi:hypothetical protein
VGTVLYPWSVLSRGSYTTTDNHIILPLNDSYIPPTCTLSIIYSKQYNCIFTLSGPSWWKLKRFWRWHLSVLLSVFSHIVKLTKTLPLFTTFSNLMPYYGKTKFDLVINKKVNCYWNMIMPHEIFWTFLKFHRNKDQVTVFSNLALLWKFSKSLNKSLLIQKAAWKLQTHVRKILVWKGLTTYSN